MSVTRAPAPIERTGRAQAARLLPLVLLLSPICGALGETSSGATAPVLWAGLEPGPYAVGYQRLSTPGLTVDTWYPSVTRETPLRFRDSMSQEDAKKLSTSLTGAGVPAADVAELLDSPLWATSATAPADGALPLVLIAQGNAEDAADQVVLCEYLASTGFVVASTPSPMLQRPLEAEDQVGGLAETQAEDLATAIKVVSGRLPVDRSRIGVVGHSFGARAALLLAMKDPHIRAVVSLDGGIGTSTAVTSFESAPSFRQDAPIPPLLHLYEELDPFMKPDFTLLRSLHGAEQVLERVEHLHHIHFTTYGFASATWPSIAKLTRATPETAAGVRAVAERTARFLHEHLADTEGRTPEP